MANKLRNTDPSEPWNDPGYRDDVMAPWNDPSKRDDPSACWNDIGGQGDYRDEADRY